MERWAAGAIILRKAAGFRRLPVRRLRPGGLLVEGRAIRYAAPVGHTTAAGPHGDHGERLAAGDRDAEANNECPVASGGHARSPREARPECEDDAFPRAPPFAAEHDRGGGKSP